MNIVTYIIFLFIFINILFFFSLPDINNDNYIFHKLLIFIGVFVFQFLIQVISNTYKGCFEAIDAVISTCLKVSIFAVFGYSLFVDAKYMDYSKEFIENITEDQQMKILVISSSIVLFILLMKILEMIFSKTTNSCTKKPDQLV